MSFRAKLYSALTAAAVRLTILFLDYIAPLSILYTLLSILLNPAPPIILFYPTYISLSSIRSYSTFLNFLSYYTLLESAWYFIHLASRRAISSGRWNLRTPKEALSTEERWRIWRKIVESSEDPWDMMSAMFLQRGAKSAPRGMKDEAITTVKMEEVGRENVEMVSLELLRGKSRKGLIAARAFV